MILAKEGRRCVRNAFVDLDIVPSWRTNGPLQLVARCSWKNATMLDEKLATLVSQSPKLTKMQLRGAYLPDIQRKTLWWNYSYTRNFSRDSFILFHFYFQIDWNWKWISGNIPHKTKCVISSQHLNICSSMLLKKSPGCWRLHQIQPHGRYLSSM